MVEHVLVKVRSHLEPYLYQSLQRKPTDFALYLCCAYHMDTSDCTDRQKWIDVIWSIERSATASDAAKKFAEDFLLDEGLIE